MAKAWIAERGLPVEAIVPPGCRAHRGAVAGPDQDPIAPDYKTLYKSGSGCGLDDSGPGGNENIFDADVQGKKLANLYPFNDMIVDGTQCGLHGIRANVSGNLWINFNAPLGYAGALVMTPQAKLLGRIRLADVCAKLAFGRSKRTMLFMSASPSSYML